MLQLHVLESFTRSVRCFKGLNLFTEKNTPYIYVICIVRIQIDVLCGIRCRWTKYKAFVHFAFTSATMGSIRAYDCMCERLRVLS